MVNEMSKGKTNRRVQAMRRIKEISTMAHKVERRDSKGVHVTVWLTPLRRVEWWPSVGRWASQGAGKAADMSGDFEAFKAWIAGEVAA